MKKHYQIYLSVDDNVKAFYDKVKELESKKRLMVVQKEEARDSVGGDKLNIVVYCDVYDYQQLVKAKNMEA